MKKLYFALVFVIIVNLIPLQSVFAEEAYQGINLTFDSFNPTNPQKCGIDQTSGNNLFSEEYEDRGGALAMTGTGGNRFYVKLNEDATEGVYRLHFDLKKTENAGLFYIRLTNKAYNGYNEENAKNMFQAYAARSTDQGFYMGTTGWVVDANTVTFSANKWYSVDMWIDMDDRNAYYYSNGEFIGKTTLSAAMTEISGFLVIGEGGTSTNIITVDNLSFEKVEIDHAKRLKKEGVAVPDLLTKSVSVDITSEEVGNIFSEQTPVSIDVDYKNREKHKAQAEIEYSVIDGSKKQVWSKKTKIELEPGENITENVKPVINKYDIYTLEVYVKIGDETDVFCEEFSYCNLPTRGVVNEKYGICSHTNKENRTELDKGMPVIQKMGVLIDREDFGWASYETAPGVYWANTERKEYFEKWLAYLEEVNMKPLIIWWPENPYVDVPGGSLIPRTEEGLLALENAAYNFALTYGDRCPYFEFSNEINNKGVEKVPPEAFAKALKAFYTGIKRGNPNAIVFGHALAEIDADWTETMFMAGGADYCDGMGVHLYPRAPEGVLDVKLQRMRDMLDSHGWNDKIIWISETVTASSIASNSMHQQAYYMIRDFVVHEKSGVAEKLIVYQIQTPGINPRDNEDWFGMINGYAAENAYGAKPAYLYFTNYLAQTEGAVYEDTIQNGEIFVVRWKKSDGNFLYLMYSFEDMMNVTMNFGTETAKMIDGYGNETQLFGIEGKYSFTLTADPIYFETNSGTFTFEETNASVDKIVGELTVGDSESFTFIPPTGTEVTFDAKDNYTVTRNENTYTVTLDEISKAYDFTGRNDGFGRDTNRDYVKLNVKKDGRLNSVMLVGFDYVEKQIDGELLVRPYTDEDEEHWVGEFVIKNNRTERNVSGTVSLKKPESLVKYVKPFRVENLAPGATFKTRFNIPYEFTKEANVYEAEFISDDGEVTEIFLGICARSNMYVPAWTKKISVLRKANEETVIDGKVTEEEWGKYLYTEFNKNEGFSGNLYAKWDGQYIYVAAKINDDVQDQKQDQTHIWLGDSLYVAMKPTTIQQHETQIGIALTENPWADKPVYHYDRSPLNDGGFLSKTLKHEAKVVREGNVTYYEVKIPWYDLADKSMVNSIKKNMNFHLNIGVRDRDGESVQEYNLAQWICLTNPQND
ncbi:MAG: hypothetical protein E7415_06150 [Ruminococcaceae bacterium]|nr:hypothetical protein [Oscillospiraceae bacterium]